MPFAPVGSFKIPTQAGFYSVRSSRAELLIDCLAAAIAAHPPVDVVTPISVCVGSRGMERWVRQRLASGPLGIAANLAFPFPADALSQAFGLSASAASAWQPARLTWPIVELLPKLANLPEFSRIGTWLRRGGGPVGPAIDQDQISLARELAVVLEQVALFRPDWVQAWESGDDPSGPETWQGALWRELRGWVAGPSASGLYAAARPLPGEAIHIFCVSSMPPSWVQAWARVGEVRPVFLYGLAPTPHYWGEHRTRAESRVMRRGARSSVARLDADAASDAQNSVLTSLGRVARDALDILLDAGADELELPTAFPDPGESNLLSCLKSDILHVRSPLEIRARHAVRRLDLGDDSFTVHACHGPTRQVEVLRESLLALFEKHPDLQPRHVVVMTPNVAAYASIVQAIFGEGIDRPLAGNAWNEVGAPRIPVSVHDLGVRGLNPVADALLRVLNLVSGRLTATEFCDVLAIDPVRRRFNIDDDELATIRRWLYGAGARWGADAAERKALSNLEQHEFSFAFALDRLALGLVLPANPESPWSEGTWQGCLGFDQAEGGQATFGKLAEVFARVARWRSELAGPYPLAIWVEKLGMAIDELTLPAKNAGFLRAEVVSGLASLRGEAGAFAGELSLDAIIYLLQSRFELSRGGDRPATGAVTVCALAPMRSVPFRVVCLLGMDDNAFPRTVVGRSFDAARQHPRPGDRDPREEDRHLLLEAILSARDHFLVFYTGFDSQTAKPLPPAVPVGDLLDAADQCYSGTTRVRDAMTTRHPVQPFSPSGFGTSPTAPRRFDSRMYTAATRLVGARGPVPAVVSPHATFPETGVPTALTLRELLDWTRRPVRTLVRERVGVSLREYDDSVSDREDLAVDALQGWALGERLSRLWMRGIRKEHEIFLGLLSEGAVPPGAPGRELVASKLAEVAAVGELLGEPAARVQHSIHLHVGGVMLTGTISSHGRELIDFALDDPHKSRRLLKAWVEWVALAASGAPVDQARLLGCARKDSPTQALLSQPPDPLLILEQLVASWREARVQLVPLFEKCSHAYAESILSADPDADSEEIEATAVDAAQSAWDSGHPDRPGEGADPTLALVFPEGPPVENPEFGERALRLWTPIFSTLDLA